MYNDMPIIKQFMATFDLTF